MIVKNELEQCMGCTLCGEMLELSRRTLANPETVLILMEHMRDDHAACEEYPHDPAKARRSREFRKRMRAELATDKPGIRRCAVKRSDRLQ